MASNILTEKELSNSAYSHIIHAPNEKVDIAAWLFTPPEAKYCRCGPPDHSPVLRRRPVMARR